jgi:hypothetical protein
VDTEETHKNINLEKPLCRESKPGPPEHKTHVVTIIRQFGCLPLLFGGGRRWNGTESTITEATTGPLYQSRIIMMMMMIMVVSVEQFVQ